MTVYCDLVLQNSHKNIVHANINFIELQLYSVLVVGTYIHTIYDGTLLHNALQLSTLMLLLLLLFNNTRHCLQSAKHVVMTTHHHYDSL